MSTALTEAFLIHRRSLLATLLKIVRDRQTAEDLAQETYLRAHLAAGDGTVRHPGAFLHQTARNLALDHERRRQMRGRYEYAAVDETDLERIAAEAPSAEDGLIERERYRQFDQALSTLPKRAKQAWKLSQLDGWPYERIADHLGVSKNTVYNDIKLVMGHCHDALRRLEQG